jgi:hypothetical protein
MKIALIAEDERDCVVYRELVTKIRAGIEIAPPIPCQGLGNLKKFFVGYLKYFEYSVQGIQKAIVIRDSDCEDGARCEKELEQILRKSHFNASFPVHFHATKCEVETWLLADEAAVNSVAQMRGKTGRSKRVNIQFESYRNAKELFSKMLSEAKLPDDPTVYQLVANAADIGRIAARCPDFKRFSSKIHAC